MKRYSYEKSRQKSLTELKQLIADIFESTDHVEYIDILNNSESIEQLLLNVQDSPKIHQYLFISLKQFADQSQDYIELEKWIVYMTVLIDPRYPALRKYKNNLISFILGCRENYFTSDEYCVLRHLIPFKKENLADIIDMGWSGLVKNSILYKIFTCEIYLIEGQYTHAKEYIDQIGFISLLEDYQEDYMNNLGKNVRVVLSANLKPKLVQRFS